MSREGRGQPIQPFAAHGFADSGVGVPGTTPPAPIVVDRADQRARYLPLPPVVISAALLSVTQPATVTPPPLVNVDQPARPRVTPDPQNATHGAVDNTPVVTVTPPAPFVVPLDERRRFLAQLPPTILQGADDVVPPTFDVTETDSTRRYRIPLDPILLSAALIPPPQPDVVPPGPYVVPLDERRRFLAALPATSQHGFLGNTPPNGVLPPPPTNLDRVDQRVRYKPLDPIFLSAALLGDGLPPAPVVVQGGTDWASAIATW